MPLDRDACYRAVLNRDPWFDGRFFTAVKTTGIYCRPICPTRPPKLANILFLPSAAAAHAAGFRPCLRCRPEIAPQIDTGCGLLSRGLALLAAGAFAEDDIAGLAGRLGVGESELRSLFREHLGASPLAVAQTRRVLFAKQLITDTALDMTEIAEAAGFTSLRRCNDVFSRLYGRAPGTLRRGTARGPGITMAVAYRPPHDFAALLGFLAARAIPGIEHVSADGYARSIALDGQAGTIEIRPGVGALRATIRFPALAALPVIVERIRRLFDLAADPSIIAAHLSADPQLAPLVAARPGLRVPGAWDGFELAVRGILGQQISVAAATRLAGKLVAAFGTRLPDEYRTEHLTHVFPAAARLADADIAAALGMPRARGRAISAVAAASVADRLLFAPRADLAQAVSRLKSLAGIGEWTAQYIAMRALREPDAFPAGDIGLLRALATDAGRPTPAAMLARAESWRPWRAYAAIHLWSAGAVPAPSTTLRAVPLPREGAGEDQLSSGLGTRWPED